MCAPMLSLRGHVEAGAAAAPQDTGAAAAPQDTSAASAASTSAASASYHYAVHTPSDCTSSSRLSCSSRLSQVTQCMPTSSHALHTTCQPNGSYGAPQSIVL